MIKCRLSDREQTLAWFLDIIRMVTEKKSLVKVRGGLSVGWRVRAVRGATTVSENSVEAIREAVHELLDELEAYNKLDPDEIISATFSATRDLDATFPASIARERPHWSNVPLLDVQQMHVEGSLERCIRFLIHFNTPNPELEIYHPYLRHAKSLRPDWTMAQATLIAKTTT